VTARRLALGSLGFALLALPAFFVGDRVGQHIGYDAGDETAVIAMGTAGLLALFLGVAALIKGSRRTSGGVVAFVAPLAGVAVVGLTIWIILRLIENSGY
jgi:hypothetical protein